MKNNSFSLKKPTFFFCCIKNISTFAPFLINNQKGKKTMKQLLNINLLNIIILLGYLVGSECRAIC